MTYITISVIVCTYNRKDMLRQALESLIRQETNGRFSYDLLVIDDASTDGTSDVVREISKNTSVPIKYVYEKGNGIACARNRGIDESSGDWVAFTDDDQLAEPDWLKELFAFASKKKACCVGGARSLYLSQQQLKNISTICRSILGEINHGTEPFKCYRKTYPCTGNVLIKRESLNKVSKFDESLKWGGSDWDLFNRLRLSGIDSWYTPKAIVHHIIPTYRFSENYLLWRSLMHGKNFANTDFKEFGFAKTAGFCIARIGQTLLIVLPLFIFNYLLNRKPEVLGQNCLLWRNIGYLRESLYILSPRLFSQNRFFGNIEFRKERKIF